MYAIKDDCSFRQVDEGMALEEGETLVAELPPAFIALLEDRFKSIVSAPSPLELRVATLEQQLAEANAALESQNATETM